MPTRVVVVDDDFITVYAISHILSAEGYEVFPAEGPMQALEIVRTNPPINLVVTDIKMPDMLGTELIREVAQLSPETASVLMTGADISSVEVPVGVPILRKPLSNADLVAAVQQALARATRARDDLAREWERSAQRSGKDPVASSAGTGYAPKSAK